MTNRALIGHTGFVGSNLARDGGFSHLYNSSNFRDMAGRRFDEVVCCGISAVKWLANKEPEQDWSAISALLDVLEQVEAGRFTLISTIDVYPNPADALDEDAALVGLPNHAYGRHRLHVETCIARRFPQHLTVRLPALFGPGLRKNALFDLINGNQVGNINPAGVFQWYPVRRLESDVEVAKRAGLNLVNLFTEPLAMSEIIGRFFPSASVGVPVNPAPVYRVRTKHAGLFGGESGFTMSSGAVLDEMGHFIDAAQAGTTR